MKKFIELGNIGWIDNVLGAGLGIGNGIIIISILVLLLRSEPFKDSGSFNSILERSFVVEICDKIISTITNTDSFNQIKDQLDELQKNK